MCELIEIPVWSSCSLFSDNIPSSSPSNKTLQTFKNAPADRFSTHSK
uniref:Uncharacterized protein n=1 Tax=Heterorhabditis bacteriophora TaxID=37862 RepID=A0A1I7W7T4_HETBA